MPKKVFYKLGLCQPAWLVLSAVKCYKQLVMALISDPEEDPKLANQITEESNNDDWSIQLPPKVAHCFQGVDFV